MSPSPGCAGVSTSPFVLGRAQQKDHLVKTAGIFLLVVGLVMTLYTGFTYVTKEKVVDLGNLEITADDHHSVQWQPYVGIGTMVIGGAALLLSRKKLRVT
jgi:hypothetical protein